ncbi:MAG: hypothetical protein IKS28_06630 [Clostridia bacterium]|nr:hypothetical protein [Clostridia bacterium]
MKKIIAVLLVAVLAIAAVACTTKTPEDSKPASTSNVPGTTEAAPTTTEQPGEEVTVLSHSEFYALEDGTENVTIEAYIQAKAYSSQYGNVALFLADDDGGYYVYRMPCTDEDDAKLVIGQKVRITGTKTSWSGLTEFAEKTAKYEILEGTKVYDAVDITNETELEKYMAMKVCVKDAEIVASTIDGDETEYAFLYQWNGAGEEGDDIYFDVKIGENTYTFVVETDLADKDSAAYKAIQGIKIGDKLDLEGFLYWYKGAQLQVTSVTVK